MPCVTANNYVTLIRLIACTGRSIIQANMSAATGYIIYAYLKFSIMGQQLVCSGYDEWTYPRDTTENFGCVSLTF